MTNNLQAWLYDFNNNRKQKYNDKGFLEGERLGQAFVNDFIRDQWKELFYEENYEKALDLIVDYLVHCSHYPQLPNKLR